MAVSGADYKFLYCGIGGKGRESDSGIFKNSEFGKALEANELR